jgi:DNA-binding CsgD family transcriptional regulator
MLSARRFWAVADVGGGVYRAVVALTGQMSNPGAPLLRLLRLNRDDEVAVALAVARPMTAISGVAKQQQRRLTKPQQAELVERYRSGDLMTELAKRFGIDRRTVSAILKRHEVPTRPQGLSVEQLQDAVLMCAQGNSLAVIGSKLGVDTGTVYNRLREQGVIMRDTHGRER